MIRLSDIKHDLAASFVVFLVALPLCMGIAIASGAPIAAGLISGIVGGLVVGVLAGSPLQVSGPAAGLTVIVYEAVQRFGLEMIGLVVLLAGLMQVSAGILRLGQWFRAVSPAVIKGMLAGIGFLILGSQLHVMIDDAPKGSGAANLASVPSAIWKALAIPETMPKNVREFRTTVLREVGELHRLQVSLWERLSEHAPQVATSAVRRASPANGSMESAGAAPEPSTGATATLPSTADAASPTLHALVAGLAPDQAEIQKRVAAIVERLEQFEPDAVGSERAQVVLVAARRALAHAEAATQHVVAGDIQAAIPAQLDAARSLQQLLDSMKNHRLAAYLGLLTILIIILWQGLMPRKLRVIPGPLVAIVVATLLAGFLTLPVLFVEVPDRLWDDIHIPTVEVLQAAPWKAIAGAALLMATVASAETLLCAGAVDQLHDGPRTQYDRELIAQGVGNTLCGLVGALPMTGVIVRSSANVQAGARTRMSAILHGAWLLTFVVLLAGILRLIPTASLAAVLVFTGYKLIDAKSLKTLWSFGIGEVAIYAATVGTIIMADLLTGVIVGILLSALKLLYTFSHLDTVLEVQRDQTAVLRVRGAATFIRLPALAAELENVPRGSELHVDFEHLSYIDHACLDLLMNWAKQHQSTGGKLVIDWESLHARFSRDSNSTARVAGGAKHASQRS